MMRQILFIVLNDSFQKIIVINRPLEEFLDSNGFVIIGIADFLNNVFHYMIFFYMKFQ